MKKFFEKASKPFNLPSLSRTNTVESSSGSTANPYTLPGHLPLATPGLGPKDVVPAVPHPRPHTHLALLATKDGLLIRPQHGPGKTLSGYVKLSWGKNISIEEMENRSEDQIDWKDSVVVYGIVGILELFSCAFTFPVLSWGWQKYLI